MKKEIKVKTTTKHLQQSVVSGGLQLTDLQCGDVVRQFVSDSRLNVHYVVFSEQVSQLLLVLINHLDHPVKHEISRHT